MNAQNNTWDTVFDWLDKAIEAVLFIIVIVMLTSGLAQVFFRYVIQSSLSWSEELMRYLYVWMTMIGAALAIRKNQFTVIETFKNLIRAKSALAGTVLYVFITGLMLGFFVLLTFWGWRVASVNFFQNSPAMGISMGGAYLALPIGGVLGILYTLISVRDYVRKSREVQAS